MVTALLCLLLIGLIGALIGAVGIGGFLVVPVLVLLQGLSVRHAVVVATLSFLVAGVVSLWAMGREGMGSSRGVAAFLLVTAPGAILGALLVTTLDERILGGFIALAFAVAGICEWMERPRARARDALRPTTGSIAGGVAGFASAITGTSGPMVAIPLLGFLGVEVHRKLRIAQVAQVPIGLAALIAYATLADVPWELAGQSATALGAGAMAGILVGRRVAGCELRRATAAMMLLSSAYMATTVL